MEKKTRTAVPLTDKERELIKQGMARSGIRDMGTYLRTAGLKEARRELADER